MWWWGIWISEKRERKSHQKGSMRLNWIYSNEWSEILHSLIIDYSWINFESIHPSNMCWSYFLHCLPHCAQYPGGIEPVPHSRNPISLQPLEDWGKALSGSKFIYYWWTIPTIAWGRDCEWISLDHLGLQAYTEPVLFGNYFSVSIVVYQHGSFYCTLCIAAPTRPIIDLV